MPKRLRSQQNERYISLIRIGFEWDAFRNLAQEAPEAQARGRGRLKSCLKARCSRRRNESAACFKNELAARAKARCHVRDGVDGLRRRAKNVSFSKVNARK